jgi:hypothetical protein
MIWAVLEGKEKNNAEAISGTAAKASTKSHRCWLTSAFLVHKHN